MKLGGQLFDIIVVKKKKKVVLEWMKFKSAKEMLVHEDGRAFRTLLGVVVYEGMTLMDGEKLDTILKMAPYLDISEDLAREWPRKEKYNIHTDHGQLLKAISYVMRVARWKDQHSELGFVTLFTDSKGIYWFRISRGFHTALNESLASLESLVDELAEKAGHEETEAVGILYRKLTALFDGLA